MRKLALIVAVLLVAGFAGAEQTQVAITNTDVVKMVQAGLGSDIIIVTIRNSTTRFDTSPEALVKLKAAKVPEQVISAMLGDRGKTSTPGIPPTAVGIVVIPDGTEIRLRLAERLTSSTAKVDDRVRLEALEDVLADGKMVIAQGAQAWGTVVEAQKKKSFGRRGKLNFTIDYVKAVDGQNVRLRTTKKMEGDESYVKAGVITYLTGPFGALVKGKDVEIEVGTVYTIFIDGDRRINLKPGTD